MLAHIEWKTKDGPEINIGTVVVNPVRVAEANSSNGRALVNNATIWVASNALIQKCAWLFVAILVDSGVSINCYTESICRQAVMTSCSVLRTFRKSWKR